MSEQKELREEIEELEKKRERLIISKYLEERSQLLNSGIDNLKIKLKLLELEIWVREQGIKLDSSGFPANKLNDRK